MTDYIHPSRRSNVKNNYISPDDSILHSQWSEPTRPYSQHELYDMEDKFFDSLFLSTDTLVQHQKCGHVYHVKKNGVRYKEIKELDIQDNSIPDVGNCSVCWKYYKTPKQLRVFVDDFIELHNECIYNSNGYKSLYDYQIKTIFYTWLYQEVY